MENKIRILLADDHAVLRSGLKLLLHNQPDMVVIGEARDGQETIELCKTLKPDVLLLDLNMPAKTGLQALEELKNTKTRILILTMYDDVAYLRQAVEWGAAGYILKSAADTELISAIRAVAQGASYYDPALMKTLVEYVVNREEKQVTPKKEADQLSEREKEVLRLVALGYTNRQIAEELTISIKTVEAHKANIREKLKLKGRAELVRFAIEQGLLSK
ncbi:MAG: response regulator transcription factor [Thermanaeromonas sp.]|uniref:response regulator n=1 Tax=Thermanaeromonas sp. TaxID=2003697 RepID=UPI00243810E4|nr:response regulator transcription factor [Thermanaeromonas sp.]MCG0278838.1 response regulator transcription factor [Thermanaeromonas sp.]